MGAFPSFFALLLFFLCAHADVDAYYQSTKFETGQAGKWPTQRFKSSRAIAPVLDFVQYGQACRDGLYTFIAPRGDSVSSAGPMILDQDGHLVWTEVRGQTYGMDMQTYKGENFVTFWTGDDTIVGHGQGSYYMLNSNYQPQYVFRGANGLRGDLHEFHITVNDTAVYTIYDKIPADLSSVGGPKKGWLWDGTFQEVDVETGELLFQWRASQHLPFDEAYRSREGHGNHASDPWDFFHINSIDKDEKGNFLISSRNYFSLTYIDGRTGKIIWKLGGKANMFKDLSDGAATNMSWQHHARWRDGGKSITLFDNSGRGEGAPIHPSRGLWIDVDQENMTAKVRGQYWNPTPISSQSQGSVQLLENGNVLVGYGFNAAWTEFNPDGEAVCEVHMGPKKFFDQGHVISYRAFKYPWVGKPTSNPDWVVLDKKGNTGYVSWNGATEVKTWILEGSNAAKPEHDTGPFVFLSAMPKTGFETTVSIPEGNIYKQLRVVGLDKLGNQLGASRFVEVEASNSTTDDSEDFPIIEDGNKSGHDSDKRMLRFIFFLVGFITCAGTCGFVIASNWAIRAYYFRRQNGSPARGNWWNNLRFGRVKSGDDDHDDDIEDLCSEMNELIAAHADEFELGDDDSQEDIEERRAEDGEMDEGNI
ncbi:hypothetical protein UA08_01241 [Talaromyces atroroseus]|uniref:ASST-domain-containing protein n=1 Tax=Talaromyces atroroseus TaxID=1441469 RepID=A0A1Q5Q9W6_TALAT|nr:hypothetical protein UA08_01241 [Talaromyces atroroseus]OKL62618.1 hypothetical protein UA08_01241 [Talaromyces atroroseus]